MFARRLVCFGIRNSLKIFTNNLYGNNYLKLSCRPNRYLSDDQQKKISVLPKDKVEVNNKNEKMPVDDEEDPRIEKLREKSLEEFEEPPPEGTPLPDDQKPNKLYRFLRRNIFKMFVLNCIIFLSYAAFAMFEINHALGKFTNISQLKLGGPFELVDHNGKPFTDKDLEGKYTIMYFGFVNCPDVCPETLSKISSILNKLPPLYHKHLQTVFVTVDPQRDTPEILKDYLKDFHPSIVGLTGPDKNLQELFNHYKVHSKVTLKFSDEDYTVDHSVATYIVNREGIAISYFFSSNDNENIISYLKNNIDCDISSFYRVLFGKSY